MQEAQTPACKDIELWSERELFYLLTLGVFCTAEEKGLHLCFTCDADFRPEDYCPQI